MANDLSSIYAGAAVPRSVVEALDELSARLHVTGELDATLARVTQAATEVVPGCQAASLTLRPGVRCETRGATGALAAEVDQLQYELGEGPCIDVIGGQRVVHTADAARDGRWPRLCQRVAGVSGAVAALSCQLAAGGPGGRRTLGSLNLYADRAGAFDAAADHLLAVLVANHAAAVIDGAHREDQLRQAIASRDVIGQAKGILMASGGIDPDAAFDQLRMASQRTNVKLRDLARQVVDARRSQADGAPPPAEAPWS